VNVLTLVISAKFEVAIEPCYAAFIDFSLKDGSVRFASQCNELSETVDHLMLMTERVHNRTKFVESAADTIGRKAHEAQAQIEHIQQEVRGIGRAKRPIAGKVLALGLWIVGVVIWMLSFVQAGLLTVVGSGKDSDGDDDEKIG
jgi:hypothetical protein